MKRGGIHAAALSYAARANPSGEFTNPHRRPSGASIFFILNTKRTHLLRPPPAQEHRKTETARRHAIRPITGLPIRRPTRGWILDIPLRHSTGRAPASYELHSRRRPCGIYRIGDPTPPIYNSIPMISRLLGSPAGKFLGFLDP